GWEHTTSDIVTIHDYTSVGEEIVRKYGAALEATLERNRPARRIVQLDPEVNRGKPVMLTEYGGISYAPQSGERWFGYGTVGSEDEYIAKVRELTDAVR